MSYVIRRERERETLHTQAPYKTAHIQTYNLRTLTHINHVNSIQALYTQTLFAQTTQDTHKQTPHTKTHTYTVLL